MRRPWFALGLGSLAVVVLVVCALTARDLLRIKSRIEAGQRSIEALDLDAAGAPGGVAAAASSAARDLRAADELARTSPWLGALRRVPVLSSQVDGLRDLTGAAAALGDAAGGAGQRIQVALDAAGGAPEARVQLLDVVLGELRRIDTELAGMRPAAGRFLLPPLSTARRSLDGKLASARTKLADATRSAAALRRFLAGPTRVLVLAATNAEMTAGSGMPNSGGVATIQGGDISLGEFIAGALLTGKPTPPVSEDLRRLYGSVGIAYDFRGQTSTPNFAAMAPITQQMAAQVPEFGAVDGVVIVDVFMLRDLLALTGPIDVDGASYSADNVMKGVLNDNYLAFADPTTQRTQRINLQADIARAAFDAVRTRHVPLAGLAKALQGAATGRHVLAWSSDPDLEEVFRKVGADGSVPEDGLLISQINVGGNKLDWYLQPKLDLQLSRRRSGDYELDVAVTISNDPRSPTSPQVEGTHPEGHLLLMDVHAPASAIALDSLDVPFSASGYDPPSLVGGFRDEIPLGTTKTWRFRLVLPSTQRSLTLLPSARVHPDLLTINGIPFGDTSVARPIDLRLVPGNRPLDRVVLGALVIAALGIGFSLSALLRRRGEPALGRADGGVMVRSARADALAATWLLAAAGVLLAAQALWLSR